VATSDDDRGHGWQVVYQDGELRHSAPAARQRGTTVVARGLFASMPARRKFLAAGAGETARIAQSVRRFALVHPGVQFSLAAESRLLLRSTGSRRLDVAAGECWGASVRAGTLELRPAERGGVALSGWIGDRATTRATRAGIVIAVNGRPVRAARCVRDHAPNPGSVTLSSDATAASMTEMKELTAFSASDFERPACPATFSMSSDLFTLPPGVRRA